MTHNPSQRIHKPHKFTIHQGVYLPIGARQLCDKRLLIELPTIELQIILYLETHEMSILVVRNTFSLACDALTVSRTGRVHHPLSKKEVAESEHQTVS